MKPIKPSSFNALSFKIKNGAVEMESNIIKEHLHKNLVVIKISKTKKLNSLDTNLLHKLKEEIENACNSKDTNIIILTGEGKFFSSGIDLEEVANSSSPEEASRPFKALGEVIESMLSCKKVIAAVLNGPAIAGGAELMLASDIVFATRDAWIQWPEIRWNIVAPMFSSILKHSPLPRLTYIALSSKRISSEEALSLGLISEVVDSVEEAYDKLINISKELMRNGNALKVYLPIIREAKKEVLKNIEDLISLSRSQELITRAKAFLSGKK